MCCATAKSSLTCSSSLPSNSAQEGVATGHYCRKETLEVDGQVTHRLLAGVDTNKDQSYFLCQLTQAQLDKAHFPIGELTKPEVRRLAEEIDLPTANKKDSQGLCFIGKVRLPDFLQQQLEPKTGDIIEIDAARAPSCRCRSNRCFTAGALGSRRWSLCRATQRRPFFYRRPAQRDSSRRQSPNPCLCSKRMWNATCSLWDKVKITPGCCGTPFASMQMKRIGFGQTGNWPSVKARMHCEVRIRYRQPLQAATITRHETLRNCFCTATIGRSRRTICGVVRWRRMHRLRSHCILIKNRSSLGAVDVFGHLVIMALRVIARRHLCEKSGQEKLQTEHHPRQRHIKSRNLCDVP